MRKTLYETTDDTEGFEVIVEVDDPAFDNIPIKLTATPTEQDYKEGIYLTTEAAIETADALYEAAGHRPPSQLVKASELGVNDALIRVAELHGLKVRFRYAKSDHDPVEVRTFVPKSLKVMDDHTTFVGLDEDRGGFRSFRTDRIKGTVEVVA
jgi:WYL domain-containing protein